MLAEINEELDNLKEQLTQLREDSKLGDDVGPCQASIDVTLKSLNVERQAYYGGCITGNQCHKLLIDKNIDILCVSIPTIVREKLGNGDLYDTAYSRSQKFSLLFRKYGRCHRVFNSAVVLTDEEITRLMADIDDYMAFLRGEFPEIRITPKLHMLEDHIIPFVQRWHSSCGFYGEQGGESLHKIINNMKLNYKHIKN